jgi:hypothetical protein
MNIPGLWLGFGENRSRRRGGEEKVAAVFKPAISNVPDYAHDGVSGQSRH